MKSALGVAIGWALLTGCRTVGPRGGNVDEEGWASFYASSLEGRPTASGEPYRQNQLTAAHRRLPFGSCVSVTAMATGKRVEVRVNDRGPFVSGRVVDLSRAAAEKLGFVRAGVARVRLRSCSK